MPRRKRVNLPAVTRADIDIEHIVSGHTVGGSRAGSAKTPFPEGWTERDIEKAVLSAYNACERVATQGRRVRVVGQGGGLEIEMWVNLESGRIETAYPV
jgi:hypothetical protein